MTETLQAGPGSALDAQIAQRVFGWVRLSGDAVPADATDRRVREPHLGGVWFKGGKRVACDECGTLPNFSVNIHDAMLIVEEAHRRGWSVDIHSQFKARMPGGALAVEWLVDFIPPRLQFPPHSTAGFAGSLPAAICAAALLVFV